MPNEEWQSCFEEAWAFREESIYRKLFGSLGAGIYALDAGPFINVFRQHSFDPRWLTHGVFECAPTAERPSWLYVSSACRMLGSHLQRTRMRSRALDVSSYSSVQRR